MLIRLALALLMGMLLAPVTARATPITFSFSSGVYSATAKFEQSGSNLIVTLTNTSTADAIAPTDILGALYFDIAGDPGLSRTSAVLAAGTHVYTIGSGADVTGNGIVGGEWAYLNNINPAPPANSGISSVGLGIFGPGDLFPGPNLQGPTTPDGVQYGITSAGDNVTTGNGGLSGNNLIKNSVVFTLGGYNGNPSADISGVTFQYGTSLDEPTYTGTPNINPNTPEPSSFVLLAMGAVGTVFVARRKCRRSR